MYGLKSKEEQEALDWLMKLTELRAVNAENKLISNLSGGQVGSRENSFIELMFVGFVVDLGCVIQARRVSLCVSMFHRPRLLVLDEPTVGVDPLLRRKIWQTLQSLAQGGTTIIITTHYVGTAHCKRVLAQAAVYVAEAKHAICLTYFTYASVQRRQQELML